jgi:hypothetical protein
MDAEIMTMLGTAGIMAALLGGVRMAAVYFGAKSRETRETDTYILSDKKGHKIKVTLNKHDPAEKRARIMVEKAEELARQQMP